MSPSHRAKTRFPLRIVIPCVAIAACLGAAVWSLIAGDRAALTILCVLAALFSAGILYVTRRQP